MHHKMLGWLLHKWSNSQFSDCCMDEKSRFAEMFTCQTFHRYLRRTRGHHFLGLALYVAILPTRDQTKDLELLGATQAFFPVARRGLLEQTIALRFLVVSAW